MSGSSSPVLLNVRLSKTGEASARAAAASTSSAEASMPMQPEQSSSSRSRNRNGESDETQARIAELQASNERYRKKAEEQDNSLIEKLTHVDQQSSKRIAHLEEHLVPCTREVKRLKEQNAALLEDLRAANEAHAQGE